MVNKISFNKFLLSIVVISSALIIRLIIIINSNDGGFDLKLYTYFGSMMLHGLNPYLAPSNGPISPIYSDMSPLNLAVFAGTLAIYKHPSTLRLMFVLVDCITISLILLFWKRSFKTRLFLSILHAINPLVLWNWFYIAEDKPISFLLIVVTLLFIEYKKIWGAVITIGLLASYKFVGIFMILPLVFGFYRDKKTTIIQFMTFGSIICISYLPYFPTNLVIFSNRAFRLNLSPCNQSPFLLLSTFGLYDPILATVIPLLFLLAVYSLFLLRKLELRSTLIFSVMLPTIFAPEIGLDRILFVTLPSLMLITDEFIQSLWPTYKRHYSRQHYE